MTVEAVAAPAPGSLETVLIRVRGRGMGRGAFHPLDKAQAPEGRGLEGFSATYTEGLRMVRDTGYPSPADGVTFKHVDGFGDIPVRSRRQGLSRCLYRYSIPMVRVELLRCGVELYCLRRLTLIKERREEA
jgi:hypothetical protein